MCGLWLQLQLQLQVTWRDSDSAPAATRWRQNANMLQRQDCVVRRASCGANQNKARQKSSRHLDLTARKLASSALDKLVKILKQLMSATGCCTWQNQTKDSHIFHTRSPPPHTAAGGGDTLKWQASRCPILSNVLSGEGRQVAVICKQSHTQWLHDQSRLVHGFPLPATGANWRSSCSARRGSGHGRGRGNGSGSAIFVLLLLSS